MTSKKLLTLFALLAVFAMVLTRAAPLPRLPQGRRAHRGPQTN